MPVREGRTNTVIDVDDTTEPKGSYNSQRVEAANYYRSLSGMLPLCNAKGIDMARIGSSTRASIITRYHQKALGPRMVNQRNDALSTNRAFPGRPKSQKSNSGSCAEGDMPADSEQ